MKDYSSIRHITYIESERYLRTSVKSWSEEKELSYLGLESIAELEKALPSNLSFVFVVGRVSPIKGTLDELLASENAINNIRKHFPEARIVLYSDLPFDTFNKIFKNKSLSFYSKKLFTPRQLVEKLERTFFNSI